MSGPSYITSSRRIYKKIKAIASLILIWPRRRSNNPGGLSNQSAANPSIINETQLVGGSSESQNRHEEKPELRFNIQPITAKLRPENDKISLRQRITACIFQTVYHRPILIGSASYKLIPLIPKIILQCQFCQPEAALCK